MTKKKLPSINLEEQLDILREANRTLRRSHWCQGDLARASQKAPEWLSWDEDKYYVPVSPRSTKAEKFCAIGAIQHAMPKNYKRRDLNYLVRRLTEAAVSLGLVHHDYHYDDIVLVNDSGAPETSFQKVKRCYNSAIKKLQREIAKSETTQGTS